MKKNSENNIGRWVNQKIKKGLVKIILFLIGALKQKETFEGELKSIIILAQEKFGDAILLTPLLRNLRRASPDLEIHVMTNSPINSFFERDPNVTAVHKGKNHYISLFKLRRAKEFDVLFCSKDHPSFTFLYQSRLLKARYRVGIHHAYHVGFFHHLIDVDFHQHVIEKNCALLDYLNLQYTQKDCRPYFPECKVSDEIKQFVLNISGKKNIGVNLSAGQKEREWPVKKWANLIDSIDAPVVVFAMPDRREDKETLERSHANVITSPATASIYEVGAILQHLDVLISPDTSLIHVASCYDVKVVGLYKSNVIHIERFYPYLVEHRKCISTTDFVEDIPVEDVIKNVRDLY